MKRFFKFTLPSIMSLWVYALYTMVDGFFVANFIGEIEFSAVNISMPLVTLLFALGILFSVGTQARVGYRLGKGEYDEANIIFSTGFTSLSIAGIIVSILLLIFLKPIANILGANNLTHDFVLEYLGIILVFGVFFMVTYQLEVLVKVDGYPHISMISVVTAAISNIVLDYLFIVPLNMGIFGAGLATGISQVISTLLMLRHFILKKGRLRFTKKVDFKRLKTLLPLGFGDSISELSMGYTTFLFNNVLLKVFGQDGVIVFTVLSYVQVFAQSTMSGVSQGLAPLFSYDYGRGAYDLIKKSIKRGLVFVSLIAIFFYVFTYLFRVDVTHLFLSDSPDLQIEAAKAIKIFCISFIFIGINLLMVTLFASLGMGRMASIISLLRTPILISVVMTLYYFYSGGGKIWYVLSISEGITTVISLGLMKKYILDVTKEKIK